MNIDENVISWEEDYDWPQSGEEWSEPWGGSDYQWLITVLPRIKKYLPANSILEIAPGRGRWTAYLHQYSKQFVGVDISGSCIKHCKARFKENKKVLFYVNDGLELNQTKDDSVNFIFSFDSLVHADSYIIYSYLKEACRVLKDGGAFFLHHSNLGSYKYSEEVEKHVRAEDVSFEEIKNFSEKIGLKCASQELINWRNKEDYLIDCFSVFVKTSQDVEYKQFKNDKFMREVEMAKRISELYN